MNIQNGSRRHLFWILLAAGIPGLVGWGISFAFPRMPPTAAGLWFSVYIVVLAAAVWVGVTCAPKVALGAPIISGLLDKALSLPALRAAVVAGVAGGLATAVFLWAIEDFRAPQLILLASRNQIPPIARILGSVTEELLIRWGLMSVSLWLLWRTLQHDKRKPRPIWLILSICMTALVFGAGHLPAAQAVGVVLTTPVIAYVLVANGAFSLVAGWLFWRYGIEAAIVAHITAHLGLIAIGR